jgi:integrase
MSEPHFNSLPVQSKPSKPHPEFPLFSHATGRWAKKIRGKLHYFGPWDNPDASLEKYMRDKDALHAGLTPALTPDQLTVFSLCGRFLTTKKQLLKTGELSKRSFEDYTATCKLLIKAFGKHQVVAGLRPPNFERLRTKMAKTWGPVRLGNEINRVRIVFNYGYKSGLLERPMVYGEGFRRPSRKTLRKHRAEQGVKMFEPDELKRMISAAKQPLKTMILLGVNCGFGNADVGTLPLSALDLQRGWVDYGRPKTGIARRCPLWPETIEALREWLTMRPEAKRPEHAELVFLTAHGDTWAKENSDRTLSKEMRKFLDGLDINGHRNFYTLRHVTQTIGDESRDFVAVQSIMGHAANDISSVYRERVSDERLHAVVDHVRTWLYGRTEGK